jgi:hypothetical protein
MSQIKKSFTEGKSFAITPATFFAAEQGVIVEI